jgi:hypothetical protein
LSVQRRSCVLTKVEKVDWNCCQQNLRAPPGHGPTTLPTPNPRALGSDAFNKLCRNLEENTLIGPAALSRALERPRRPRRRTAPPGPSRPARRPRAPRVQELVHVCVFLFLCLLSLFLLLLLLLLFLLLLLLLLLLSPLTRAASGEICAAARRPARRRAA